VRQWLPSSSLHEIRAPHKFGSVVTNQIRDVPGSTSIHGGTSPPVVGPPDPSAVQLAPRFRDRTTNSGPCNVRWRLRAVTSPGRVHHSPRPCDPDRGSLDRLPDEHHARERSIRRLPAQPDPPGVMGDRRSRLIACSAETRGRGLPRRCANRQSQDEQRCDRCEHHGCSFGADQQPRPRQPRRAVDPAAVSVTPRPTGQPRRVRGTGSGARRRRCLGRRQLDRCERRRRGD
jgi:hypothetical protein